jgi:DNA-directed RNA polymerase specialized sigma24 family protein
MPDERELDTLVTAAAARHEPSWKLLWCAIEPPLLRILSQPSFLGRVSQRADDRRDIVVAVMARLRSDDFRRLRMYVEAKRRNPQLRFFSWLRVVAKRVGVDYVRAHPDYVRNDTRWIELNTLPPASQIAGERPPMTDRGTARELLGYATDAIPDDQRRALELWTQGESFDSIGRSLGIADAGRTVRAAIERLRRRFRS